MLGTTAAGEPSPEARRRATRTVKRHARDGEDEAELLAMLGLDHTAAPPSAPHRPHGPLTAAELRELLAPFAAGRAGQVPAPPPPR
ncbi:hypothetical protein [Amycolatopsis sp. NPDC021455]|uniref:hypothetical protein n=1 Tax=Amycolatopsis sp. NPDC021455 TaxID=3154901 RepID=UPI0033D152B6